MGVIYRLSAKVVCATGRLRREEGQTFTEYAVIVGAIALGVVAAIGTLRSAVYTALTNGAADI